MDSHQSAGFAFDMNMDFSNVFATKPNEGETSNSFFFGDEGIDTTASIAMDPILFPQHTAFDMQQDLSLDNTSGSSSIWNGQLTPEMQNTLNSFPPTPSHSFDSMYQSNFNSSLGKRPLQLDIQDFPAAKRLETADFTSTSLFSPLPSSTTTWDAQLTPAASVEVGLSDEAADMCAMWFNKYAILPSDRHIDSLSQLTGESADAIRHWFGRLMKQGMNTAGQTDSAYKSQTGLHQPDQFWNNDYSTDLIQHEAITTNSTDLIQHETTTATSNKQSVNTLRGGKKSRCTPTDDLSLLSRDSSKIYQCTRKCGKRYGRKCDWKRNEEEGYPCKSWVCSLCTSTGVENVKPCFRKYHFAQHFRNIHPGVSCDAYEEASVVCSETEFPRKCGFCKARFASRQERIDHIAEHFKQGKCMLDWNDGDDSDNSDGFDDDDRPSDDDSDSSRPAYQPPPSDPRGGSNTKYYGSGGDHAGGGDSSNGGSQGGYFQFQLSQLNEGDTGSECYYAEQPIKPTNVLQDTQQQQRKRCSSEPIQQRSIEIHSSLGASSSHGKSDAAEGDHTNALARDALSGSLAQQDEVDTLDAAPDWLDVLLKSRSRITVGKATHSGNTKKAIHTIPTANGKLAKATSAAPMFSNHTKLDQNGMSDPAVLLKRAATPATGKLSSQAAGILPPESKVLQTIPMNAQSFLSVRFLGSGGFSTVDEVVHRGTNLRLGRKTLKNRGPAAIQDLWKEVGVLQKLRHPHVIRFLGAYSQGDKMSILLAPIADTTLSLWLDRFSSQKPANFSQVITKMFGCLASSVRYLHEQRPVVKHLDIKPQNILIVEGDGEFPHVVLCDFGISTSDDLSVQTQPLTRQYVAPEVFGGSTRTVAADIWSLGCVFAEMASVSYSPGNYKWLSFRKEFSGRTGKYYWQDVAGLQDRLTTLLEYATTVTENTVVRTLKAMLRPQPTERPDTAALTLVFTPAPCCLSWPNDNVAYPGPQEELSSVEMLVHEDGVDCTTQLHQHAELSTASTQDLASAKNWLEQCSHSHELCSHLPRADAHTLPSRLLDIQPSGEDSNVRLVDTTAIESRPGRVGYVALSHTWNETQATLTTENLQTMETCVPPCALSDTLKTAIASAQRLGYRYIWTDSLCVIQDSEEDKREECANMASVFRNAALTLVLDSIDNGLGDFRASLAESPSAFSWDTRAWSLQERLLSRRFLHLGQEQMYWECNSLKASETFPQGLPLLVWEKAHSKPKAPQDNQLDLNDKPAANAKNAANPDSATTNDKTASLQPHRLRNCQWIRKEGDGMGDSMEAAQTTLELNAAGASPANKHAPTDAPTFIDDKLGNFPVFTTSTCGDGTTRNSGKDPATCKLSTEVPAQHSTLDRGKASASRSASMAELRNRTKLPIELAALHSMHDQSKASASKSASMAELRSKAARQEMSASGQMDQNGNAKGVNGNVRLEDDGGDADVGSKE